MKLIKVDRDINIVLCWLNWLRGRSWVALIMFKLNQVTGPSKCGEWENDISVVGSEHAITGSGVNIKLCLMAKRSNHIWLMLGVSPLVAAACYCFERAVSVSGRGRVRRSGRWRDNVPGSHHQMISLTVRTLHTLPIIRHHSDPIRGIMSLGLSHDGFDGYNKMQCLKRTS